MDPKLKHNSTIKNGIKTQYFAYNHKLLNKFKKTLEKEMITKY